MAGEYRSLKKQHYLNLIKKCASIGKNKQQWCSKNGIEYSTFMRWQALLRDEVADQVMEQQAIVPVKIAPLIVSTNNIVERTVKPFVMSCKNFLFCSTSKDADISALCFSMIVTAKRNGRDSFRYLLFLLQELPKLSDESAREQLERLFPWSDTIPADCHPT